MVVLTFHSSCLFFFCCFFLQFTWRFDYTQVIFLRQLIDWCTLLFNTILLIAWRSLVYQSVIKMPQIKYLANHSESLRHIISSHGNMMLKEYYFVYLPLSSPLTFPESTTKRTPSMVTDVSAMLVEMMHLRTPSGATSNTWDTVYIQHVHIHDNTPK